MKLRSIMSILAQHDSTYEVPCLLLLPPSSWLLGVTWLARWKAWTPPPPQTGRLWTTETTLSVVMETRWRCDLASGVLSRHLVNLDI